GRLSVRTAEELHAVVEKIVNYQTPASASSALIFSGFKTDRDFDQGAESALAKVPAGIDAPPVRLQSVGGDPARQQPFGFLGGKPGVVKYFGHGSVELWADHLLESEDEPMLAHLQPAVFASMTCLNGYFHDVYTESLAETLLKAPGG